MAEGIRKLHSKGCPAKQGERCRCKAGYEASVYSSREGRKVRKTFAREAEAKSWRSEAKQALSSGRALQPKVIGPSLSEAWEAWLEGARAGTILNRSRKPYKPSALRSYDRAMRLRVLPKLGRSRLTEIAHDQLQDFADELMTADLAPSTIQVTFLPIRAVFRRAVKRSDSGVSVNPCTDLEMPKVTGGRDRIASPEEAAKLLAAIPKTGDRAIWATAMYAGLRRGELRALRREDVDLASGVIRVRKGWDPYEGEIELKSEAGRRRVPITALLRDILDEWIASRDLSPADRIFNGGRLGAAFSADKLQMRADKAWEAAGLNRITLHECRHTFASLMIAAGIASGRFNPKALSEYMGHASIQITYDQYGHLMPGAEAEAAAMLDSFLAAQRADAEDIARAADGVLTGEPTGERDAREPVKPL